MAMQSWVNREYRRVLSTHPYGAPVFRISTTWGRPIRKSRTQAHRVELRPRCASLMLSVAGTMVGKAEL